MIGRHVSRHDSKQCKHANTIASKRRKAKQHEFLLRSSESMQAWQLTRAAEVTHSRGERCKKRLESHTLITNSSSNDTEEL